MAILLALASAIVYGSADFLGGLATRRNTALAVVVWSQLVGVALLPIAIVALAQPFPSAHDLAWGAAGGVGGTLGVVLLYRGLAIGRMAIVAPTAAVGAACIPVIVGIALGERPSIPAVVGVIIALVAIVLVSASTSAEAETASTREGLLHAAGAGVGFAAFFIFLANTGPEAGLWPLLTARLAISIAVVIALATRTSLRPVRGSWRLVAAAGALDMAANLLFLLASRRGLLSLVAVIVSLYPATTVLLARFVLSERLHGRQIAGLLAAGAGVALIAAA